ncbi:NAD(P)-binding protein [Microvirga tunisiensis]|uniref:NAD(P)-binding protein n=2 Tax=Pannonibacter tanglangensis TaxID=2750084 RepID=A0ABW9ZC64_9HYPH|nr:MULTISPECIES: FAD-dependent oxidoreductase [unclassified Pannonibacter]NBN62405.1 NAD(P)-binding protein [Pannonibacter sp. XCT-34]NBN78061.1 NAD(P)-binding protein [Pannonibacter sp. XCT-53]
MRIAVIGSGISGNSAAYALCDQHEVILYEKRLRPGGHSATVDIDYDGLPMTVDTGFIVYNELNYPNLTALFAHLDVKTEASDMSFALSVDGGRREWAGSDLNSIFAQRSNLVSPRFLWMLREILRFNRICTRDRADGLVAGKSLGDYLAFRRFSRAFIDDYLVPMGAAIWSTPPSEMLAFPADSFIAFFENHRLINFDRPIWRTVSGGSRTYVQRLLAPLKGNVRLGSPVVGVRRAGGKVHVRDSSGHEDVFDQVILASHTDQTLAMLEDPSDDERRILGAIRYRPNAVYLHRDLALMPKRKRVWSSWNYMARSDAQSGTEVSVSYWMNRLQNLDPTRPLFVSLNPPVPPREDLTFARFTYDHPQFDGAALAAQRQVKDIQGVNGTWYCGAWNGHGFHEDGLVSGLAVARAFGAVLPWDTLGQAGGTPPLGVAEAAE